MNPIMIYCLVLLMVTIYSIQITWFFDITNNLKMTMTTTRFIPTITLSIWNQMYYLWPNSPITKCFHIVLLSVNFLLLYFRQGHNILSVSCLIQCTSAWYMNIYRPLRNSFVTLVSESLCIFIQLCNS